MITPNRMKWIGMWYAWERWEMHKNFGQEAWKKDNHFGDQIIQIVQLNKKPAHRIYKPCHSCITEYWLMSPPTLKYQSHTNIGLRLFRVDNINCSRVSNDGSHLMVLSSVQWTLSTVAQQAMMIPTCSTLYFRVDNINCSTASNDDSHLRYSIL